MRFNRGGGTSAASFSINSVGLSINDVVPSAHGVFKVNGDRFAVS